MARSKNSRKGIFCLEGDWECNLTRSYTVEPILHLLERSQNMRYIHRHVGVLEELRHYLDVWAQKRYAAYPILYLAFHGEAETVLTSDRVGARKGSSFDDLGEWLAGKCHHRIIHFGGCSMLKTSKSRRDKFLATTGALAITGYTVDVDWTQAAAFEVLLLSNMFWRAFNRQGAQVIERDVRKQAKGLAKDLGFRMCVRPAVSGPVRLRR